LVVRIHRVAASGVPTSAVTTLDEADGETQHWYPFFLPDGKHFLYFALGNKTGGATEARGLYVGSLDSQETQILFSAVTRIAYAPPGFLLYVSQGALVAQPFDPQKLKVMGESTVVAERIASVGANHEFDFSVSDNGVLLIKPAAFSRSWFGLIGRERSYRRWET
jgi:hypothetical protein